LGRNHKDIRPTKFRWFGRSQYEISKFKLLNRQPIKKEISWLKWLERDKEDISESKHLQRTHIYYWFLLYLFTPSLKKKYFLSLSPSTSILLIQYKYKNHAYHVMCSLFLVGNIHWSMNSRQCRRTPVPL
jgi:hypothetical protein